LAPFAARASEDDVDDCEAVRLASGVRNRFGDWKVKYTKNHSLYHEFQRSYIALYKLFELPVDLTII